MKRQRGRSRRSGGGSNNNNNINRHFESNGPDVKIRGSAQQILEKYLQYARDAQTSGDRVMSEAYFQHAEHYQRILEAMQAHQKPRREGSGDRDSNDEDDDATDRGDAAPQDQTGEDGYDKPGHGGRGSGSKSDPLRVIDEDQDGETGRGSGTSSNRRDEDGPDGGNGEGEERAKRPRRRSYRKREADSSDGGDTTSQGAHQETENDDSPDTGVMKTLSRTRRANGHDAESEAPTPEGPSDNPSEAETAK